VGRVSTRHAFLKFFAGLKSDPQNHHAPCGSGFNPTCFFEILCRTEVRPTKPSRSLWVGFQPDMLFLKFFDGLKSDPQNHHALCGSGFNPTCFFEILCRTEVRPTKPSHSCGSGFNPTCFFEILCRTEVRPTEPGAFTVSRIRPRPHGRDHRASPDTTPHRLIRSGSRSNAGRPAARLPPRN